MKIVQLKAENIKRLKVVQITPTGDVIQITGPNGSGKTSVLDAIYYALGGKGAIPSAPVRRGAKRAMVKLDLGDIVVTRRFLADGHSDLLVENAEGAEYRSPQALLDGLIGRMAFDPLEFQRMKPKDQLDMLRSVVDVGIDIDALDAASKEDYDERTLVGRQAKAVRAQADGVVVPDDLPDEPVDTAALQQAVEAAIAHNGSIETRRANRAVVLQKANAAAARAIDLRSRADQLRAQAAELDAEAIQVQAEADREHARLAEAGPLPEAIDVDVARGELTRAQAVNKGIEARAAQEKLAAEATRLEARYAALTDAIDERTRQRAEAIASAAMPVPGLGFGDGEVTLNDLPFAQASGAEQLRTSLAVAMAANPRLRIIRIKDGSLLDENGIRLVAEMAAERDFQVWMECVDTSGKVGVVMRDGEVDHVVDAAPAEV